MTLLLRSKTARLFFVVATIAAGPSASQDLVPPLYVAPTVPNVAGLAFGRAPQYIGADEYITGPAPILRFQQPGSTRAVALLGTVFSANILDCPVLRTGPTGVYRLGRSDVDDEVVAHLPEIDASIDLGWTLGAEYTEPENAARRIRADVNFRSVVTGTHQSHVLRGQRIGLDADTFLSAWSLRRCHLGAATTT